MASQKYFISANASQTAINITNDKNSVVYSISGAINAYATPSSQLGKGFTYTISNANGTGSITTAGTNYTDGTYTGVWLSGGTGAGALYTIVVSGGVVTTVTKTTSSTTNYTVGDVLTISSLPYAYESIVLMNTNTIPNQVGQLFSMPLNSISTINGVSVTAYTNVQMINAIQSLALSLTGYSSVSAAIQTSAAVLTTVVKGSAGKIVNVTCFNSGTTAAYIKIYDKATTPSASDTPIYRGVIPANNSNGAGFVIPLNIGVGCLSGISYRVTGAIADNDTTALTANTILVNVAYS